MLATPGALPEGPEWLYEVKWDGMRLLADVEERVLRLTAGRDVTAYFPELAGLAEVAPDVVLDGEIVVLDGGVPSRAALAERLKGSIEPGVRSVTYMVFDVLRLYGVPLLDRPFGERRATLERLDIAAVPALTLSPTYADGRALLAVTGQRGLGGVVAKRTDGVYRPGLRSPGWVMVSHGAGRRRRPGAG
jgi:bifunctional non-homologous end joining protein LigD